MGTSYYHFRAPITYVHIAEGQVLDKLDVFVHLVAVGTLRLEHGIGRTVAMYFADVVDTDLAPIHTHWGGYERGCVVDIRDRNLCDDMYLISEHGDVHRVRDIKALNGKERMAKGNQEREGKETG